MSELRKDKRGQEISRESFTRYRNETARTI